MELCKFDHEYMAARAASKILVDEHSAIMTKKEFDDLPTYSCTMPTGVFLGKRWKRDDNEARRFRAPKPGPDIPEDWWMGEYAESDKPNMCANVWRKIYVL